MGMTVNIYRDESYGPTARRANRFGSVEELTLVNVAGPFSPTVERPAAVLVEGNVPQAAKIVAVMGCEPGEGDYGEDGEYKELEGAGLGPMMGGTYAATSDSRFAEAVEILTGSRSGAIPIHDRYE